MRASRISAPMLVAAVGLGSILAAPAAAQTPDGVPRTAWGAPDLGGVWDYRSVTPLERPEQSPTRPC